MNDLVHTEVLASKPQPLPDRQRRCHDQQLQKQPQWRTQDSFQSSLEPLRNGTSSHQRQQQPALLIILFQGTAKQTNNNSNKSSSLLTPPPPHMTIFLYNKPDDCDHSAVEENKGTCAPLRPRDSCQISHRCKPDRKCNRSKHTSVQ